MNTPITQRQATASGLVLELPEAVAPVAPHSSDSWVPLKPEQQAMLDTQVSDTVNALLRGELHTPAFQAQVQGALALGQHEIAAAAAIMQSQLVQRHASGVDDAAAFDTLGRLRNELEALNPDRAGDLTRPRKLLGLLPLGDPLAPYFRRFGAAVPRLHALVSQLYAARDTLQRDVVDLEATRARLWDAMQRLAGAGYAVRTLDSALAQALQQLQGADPLRARALSDEVLFALRRNLLDLQTQQAVCINGYLALDVLRKTGRELMAGCTRAATTGLSALALAQLVARATGHQMKVMQMLGSVNDALSGVQADSARQLQQHAQRSADFARNPALGVQQVQAMFDQAFETMGAMERFRSHAQEALERNRSLLDAQAR